MGKLGLYIHVGLDDTDSNKLGMCTTYVGVVLDERLRRDLRLTRVGHIRLVRLNPACPYKTRGNGSVHMVYKVSEKAPLTGLVSDVISVAEDVMAKLARLNDPDTDPALVVAVFDNVQASRPLVEHYRRALTNIVGLEEARSLFNSIRASGLWFKKGRGLVGALAAIGAPMEDFVSYELLAYRTPENYGKPRLVDAESVRVMDLMTWPCTYDNLDWYSNEILISPHTPCPVLLGIRGFSEECVREAFKLVKILEPVERVSVFITNQGSGLHVLDASGVPDIKPYTTIRLDAIVDSKAYMGEGGHVFAWVRDAAGNRIRVAAYEPTKHFRKILLALEPGDRVTIVGSYKPRPGEPATINLEAIAVNSLSTKRELIRPSCPRCGSKMESVGRDKGYRCKKCGYKSPGARPKAVRAPRGILTGVFIPPPRAHRHLTKPVVEDLLYRGAAAGTLGGDAPIEPGPGAPQAPVLPLHHGGHRERRA